MDSPRLIDFTICRVFNGGVLVSELELVQTTDARLSDARTPLSHTHATAEVVGLTAELESLQEQIDATSSGAATWTEVELDFGSSPAYDAQFTVVDATVNGSSKVVVVPSGKAATGRTADDWQWDGITFAALPAAGSFTVYAVAHPGPVMGKRKVQYSVAA